MINGLRKGTVFAGLCIWLSSVPSFSNPPYFSTLSIKEGLPSNILNSVAQDQNKFIWIGTANGLARYDGYHFKTFRKGELANTLPSNQISSLLADDEFIWVGTWNGLCRINTLTFEISRVDLGAHNVIRVLYKDRDNIIWIGTATALLRFEKASNRITIFTNQNSQLSHNTIRSIYKDAQSNLWVGTYDKLNRLAQGESKFTSFDLKGAYKPSLKNNLICDIQPLSRKSDSLLWVGTETGLCLFNPRTGKYKHYSDKNVAFSNEVIKTIYIDDHQKLWLGTDFGLDVFDPESLYCTTYFHNPQLSYSVANNVIWQIFEDSGGVIWFVTSNGISKLNKYQNIYEYQEVSHKIENQTIGNQVKATLVTKNGILWLATLHGALRIDRAKNNKRLFDTGCDPNSKILLNNVFALEEDEGGRIWIGTAGGINVWDERKQKMYAITSNSQNGLTSNYIAKFTKGADGSFWLSAWEGGLYKIVGDFNDPNSIRFQLMGDFGSEKNAAGKNAIWVVKDNELYRIDLHSSKNERIQSFHNVSKRRDIHCLFHSETGKLWAGTLNGLIEYDPDQDKVVYHPIQTGTETNFGSVMEGNDGNIWATTNNFIIKYIVSDNRFERFPLDRDLPLKSFFNGCSSKGLAGEIIFGGDNGYITLFPDAVYPNLYKPPVYITALKINNADASADELADGLVLPGNASMARDIVLDYTQRSVTFEFSSLHYWQPAMNIYSYKLEGFDRDWNFVSGEKNFAIYSNLSPKEYTFRVRGTNNNGIWSDQVAVMKFRVKAPLFLSSGFILFYVALILAAIYFSLRAYSARLHLKNELKIIRMEKAHSEEIAQTKHQFFTNISHELRTPISLILPPIHQIIKRGNLDAENEKLITLAEKNSQRLLKLVDQILDFRKLENGSLPLKVTSFDIVQFCREVYSLFADKANRNDIDFTFYSTIDDCKLWADREKLETIFFNLLSNAFKFTHKGGTIGVLLEVGASCPGYPGGFVEARVRDSGIGIPPEEQARIFERFYQTASARQMNAGYGIGLTLASEYAKLHHGELKVSSEPGKGTSFNLVLPLGSSHFPVDSIHEDLELNLLATKSVQQDNLDRSYRLDLQSNKPLVLIVENNNEIVDFIRMSLKEKYNFIIAGNGEEGLAKAGTFLPEIILSDIRMPVMDGLTLCKKVKENPKTSHISIIILTAQKLTEQKVEGIRVGADSYLTKPFEIELLEAHMDHLLKRNQELKSYFRNELILPPEHSATANGLANGEEKFINKVMSIIEANISNPDFSVEILSKEMGMSTTNLYRKLKSITQLSANEIIKRYRIKKSSLLLKNKEGNISEIMYDVGFSNLSYFSKCFRKEYGVSPKDYQLKAGIHGMEIEKRLDVEVGRIR